MRRQHHQRDASAGGTSLKVIRRKLCRLEKTFLRGGDLGLPQTKEEAGRLESYEELEELYSSMRQLAKNSLMTGPLQ